MVRFRVNGLIKTYQVSEIQDIQFGTLSGSTGSAPPPAAAAAPQPASAGTPSPVDAAPAGSVSPARDASAREGSSGSRASRQTAVDAELTLAAGTVIHVRSSELIDSDNARVGDLFSAILDQDLMLGRELIAERGSEARLRIGQVEEAGEFKGRTVLVLDLIELTVKGTAVALNATPVEQRGEAQGRKATTTVGGAAAVGAIIGAIAGGGKGAAIGAAVGAGSGATYQILTRGEKLKVPAETILEFSLQQDLTIRR